MNEHADRKQLDDELRRVIDTSRPEFDAEAWKDKYAGEYETLVSRGQGVAPSAASGRRTIRIGSIGTLAAAAAIIVVVGLLAGRFGREPTRPTAPPRARAQSPAKIVSMASLSAAFRQGGMEALDKQFDEALDTLGPRPNGDSMAELLGDLES
jgi:hypothetical protein